MPSRPTAFDKLTKILKLEADTGYRDKAMIGGLSQYAARWQQDAGESDAVKPIVEMLQGYSQLASIDLRREAIARIGQLIESAPSLIKSEAEAKLEQAAPIEPTGSAVETTTDRAAPIESAPASGPIVSARPDRDSIAQKPIGDQPPPRPALRPAPEPRDEHGNRIGLDSPITVVRDVGPARAEQFERLGVKAIRDLLYLLPRR